MRRPRRAGDKRGQIVDLVSISKRPATVEDRAVPGHWEGDLLSGSKNSYIATLVERQTRYVTLTKVANKDTQTVVSALIKQAKTIPNELYKSLTWDRGKELADHRRLTLATKSTFTSAIRKVRGSVVPIRTPTVCCGSTCRSGLTCPCTRKPSSTKWLAAQRTTTQNLGFATQPNDLMLVLHRPLEPAQGLAGAQWLADRQAELLPVPYFHVVFTLPVSAAEIAFQNKTVVYAMLFRAAAETLAIIAADPKHLGAKLGVTMVLHTWGQTLQHHPHVHCVVPGGGPSLDGTRWVACRTSFFFPVRVLGRLFRRLFLHELENAFNAGKLRFFNNLANLAEPQVFARRIGELRRLEWVVYAKPPFGGPQQVALLTLRMPRAWRFCAPAKMRAWIGAESNLIDPRSAIICDCRSLSSGVRPLTCSSSIWA